MFSLKVCKATARATALSSFPPHMNVLECLMEHKQLGAWRLYLVKYLNIFLKIVKEKLKWETHLLL